MRKAKSIVSFGYDGRAIAAGSRVELHPGCDLWARGARFGTVARVYHTRARGILGYRVPCERARVTLDATGRTVSMPVGNLRFVG